MYIHIPGPGTLRGRRSTAEAAMFEISTSTKPTKPAAMFICLCIHIYIYIHIAKQRCSKSQTRRNSTPCFCLCISGDVETWLE